MTWIFPAAAAIVAGIFAAMLTRRWIERRRSFEGLWAIAMAMYAVASLSLMVGAAAGWSNLAFRGYWLFGAILTVPYLAAGEALLLFPSRRVRAWALGLLGVLTVVALVVVASTPVFGASYELELPRGALAYQDGRLPLTIARIYAYSAFVLLIAGTLWAAWRRRGKPDLRLRFVGTLLVALGASVAAGGSAFAAHGLLTGFSLTLLGGICLMFWGFLVASRSPRRQVQAPV